MTQATSVKPARPLSPHLQIYRWSITMTLSILHRATGVALVVGSVLLVGWIWAAAYNTACFEGIHHFFSGALGKLLLVGWTVAFYLHLCNGIRHLFWDTGAGFELHTAKRSGWAVVIATFALTAITWGIIFTGGAR